MVEQHLPLRATGLARALGVLVLLAGIVAMHAAVFAVHGEATAADHHAEARSDPIGNTMPMLSGAVLMRTGSDAVSAEHGIAGNEGRSLLATPLTIRETATNHAAPEPDCAGDGCTGTHGGMHGCVFILVAAALLLALVLLYRLGVARPGNDVARLRHRRPRRDRSPPWTVLSLAELSILRI
ncbi:DUF6153 family protein [Nocardia sp. NPDC051756]|uniref:DUF6153 family protein n=1 Tax=Nocardia sp. NPDC051756 TaxID=3154751 RepID=UPI003434CFEA